VPITLTQFDRIEVEWLDAALGYNYDGPSAEAGCLALMTRVGYFISRKREPKSRMTYIVVASERGEGDSVREPMAIPEQWVTKITHLSEGKAYARKGRKNAR
jgi:hypothetical protein